MNTPLQPFHLALPVADLDAAEAFYCGTLGFEKGRTDLRWIDLDFYGHQVTLHLVDDQDGLPPTNPVDGDKVPARHFGVVLDMADWRVLARRLEEAGTEFLIAPKIRFEGEAGEQATMFFHDPSGNALEFKSFKDLTQLFAT
ncbi:MAG: VOC family protein [Gammaproteobacteria bacterium]|nr:VOC family protein [Gammaproteobacteria bacterium]